MTVVARDCEIDHRPRLFTGHVNVRRACAAGVIHGAHLLASAYRLALRQSWKSGDINKASTVPICISYVDVVGRIVLAGTLTRWLVDVRISALNVDCAAFGGIDGCSHLKVVSGITNILGGMGCLGCWIDNRVERCADSTVGANGCIRVRVAARRELLRHLLTAQVGGVPSRWGQSEDVRPVSGAGRLPEKSAYPARTWADVRTGAIQETAGVKGKDAGLSEGAARILAHALNLARKG